MQESSRRGVGKCRAVVAAMGPMQRVDLLRAQRAVLGRWMMTRIRARIVLRVMRVSIARVGVMEHDRHTSVRLAHLMMTRTARRRV